MAMRGKSKEKTIYVCSSCGRSYARWLGKCPECDEWNTITEEKIVTRPAGGQRRSDQSTEAFSLASQPLDSHQILATGMSELDQLLGGGLVPDSSILIGGEPGVGKSTLILQACGTLAEQGITSLYLSGEESVQQIALRGRRIEVDSDRVQVAAARELPQIYSLINKVAPDVVVIDSVQTLYDPDLESAPGTVSQIRSGCSEIVDFCKRSGRIVILIGHITKEGAIAGPKILEHLVDVVLYFEGENQNLFRILRVRKNRFGPSSEIGIFEIKEDGLHAVANPSEMFLDDHADSVPGRAIVTVVEGQRPLLLEIQALAAQTNFGFPQRVSSGYDLRRLALMLAILEKREKIPFGQRDVFVNLAGGLRVDDPALDLGLIAAVVSSVEDTPIKSATAIMGEVGLSGEVRAISYIERRIKESLKLGFNHLVLPQRNLRGLKLPEEVVVTGVKRISELPDAILI
jgi:DNA repair protein RadA/Sms